LRSIQRRGKEVNEQSKKILRHFRKIQNYNTLS
jgi:hypothetical protein